MTGAGESTGLGRIAEAFARARAEGRRAALMPYMMGGYPTMDTSRAIGEAYLESGADLIELGVPFSDPLADGPVIHAAATAALAAGASTAAVLELAGALTRVAAEVPIVLMCYVNPILARGVERFVDTLAGAGVSGLIVPDVPREEAAPFAAACAAVGLALIPLVAPTTGPQRMREIGERASGFLYTVAVTGTTGERPGNRDPALADPAETDPTAALIARARAATEVPVAIGFGISTPAQAAAAAAAGADGVIVGSRLVRAAGGEGPGGADPIARVADTVRGLAAALAAA